MNAGRGRRWHPHSRGAAAAFQPPLQATNLESLKQQEKTMEETLGTLRRQIQSLEEAQTTPETD